MLGDTRKRLGGTGKRLGGSGGYWGELERDWGVLGGKLEALGALLNPFLPADILLNVFLAIAVDNLADGDNINSGAEGKK